MTALENAAATLTAGTIVTTEAGQYLHDGATAGGTAVGGGGTGDVAWGDIGGTLGEQEDLAAALASAGAETPTWSNEFTDALTGLTAYNGGSVTEGYANSRVVVGNGAGSAKGASLGNFTPTIGQTYYLLIYVDTAPSVTWEVFSKTTFTASYKILTITAAGWYGFAFTTDAASKPIIVAASGTAASTLNIGYAAIYTAPSATLKNFASKAVVDYNLAVVNAAKVDKEASAVAIGASQQPAAIAGVPTPDARCVAIGPGAIAGVSAGVVIGNGASNASGTGSSIYGYGFSGGGENVALGSSAWAASWRCTAIGTRSMALPVSCHSYGFYTTCGLAHSIAMGRSGSIPSNLPTDVGYGATFSAEPMDVYFGGGSCSVMANPYLPEDYTLTVDDRGQLANVRRVVIHGPDAFDSRTGGTTAASTTYADVAARNAISVANRMCGMIVYVSAEKKSYLLGAALDVSAIKRVASYERTGTTLTFTFRAAHGLTAGMTVTIWGMTSTAYNGTYTVGSAPTTTSITVTHGTSGTVALTNELSGQSIKNTLADNSLWVDLSTDWARTVTHRSRTDNVATLRLSSAHYLSVGNVVTISGMTDSSYDAAEVTITNVTPDAGESHIISYANTGSNEGTRSSPVSNAAGTETPHDVRSFNQPGRDITIAGGRPTGTGAHGRVVLASCSALDANPSDNVKGTLREFVVVDGAEDATDASAVKLRWNGTEYRVKVGASGTGPGGVGRALYLL